MKKLILALLSACILFTSCDNNSTNLPVSTQTPAIDTTTAKATDKQLDPLLSNALMFGGCGFGKAFISFIKTQNYNIALKFTSKGSIEKYGSNKIIAFYKSIKVAYKLVPVSASVSGDTTILNYTTKEFATSKIKQFSVVVENDSVKLCLPDNLNEFLK